jgi:branched-chain amino acid transport system ATP-binding protein
VSVSAVTAQADGPREEVSALDVRDLSVHYGGVRALHGVSFHVPTGTCVGLIGANGAGKTTILRAISGLVNADRGSEITVSGRRIDQMRAEVRAKEGLGHVLERRHIFPTLSVQENLNLGAALGGGSRADREQRIESALSFFPLLRTMLGKSGASLSGGQQQFLAIARALAAAPRILLLDEPSVGLAPELVDEVGRTIVSLTDDGMTVLLVEQALTVIQMAASTVHAVSHGRIVGQFQEAEMGLADWAHKIYLE